MLTLYVNTQADSFDTTPLQALLDQAFPRSGLDLLHFEQQTLAASAHLGDAVTRRQIERAHQDAAFVAEAIAAARARSSVRLRHKGTRTTSVQLLGGTRIVVATPYLRQDRSRQRGRTRQKRHETGTGCYPVLEALGIADRATPATRSELALHLVQGASYQEAAQLVERRGLHCDVSTMVRVTSALADESLRLREIALQAACQVEIPRQGPLAGKRVRVSLDGGRVRMRQNKRGRRTKKGRHAFATPWREPRVLVIDVLDAEGAPDRLRLPLYDTTLGDAQATWALVIGYLRLLGAAHATVVEFIADGAPWIWDQIGQLRELAEIPADRLVEVVDFYHAAEHLSDAVELIKQMPQTRREELFERLRHVLRHDADGIARVIETLRGYAVARRGKAMKKALLYFERHRERMRYVQLDEAKLPVGSGQVESAVRRVVNLRFKAPGTFWNESSVGGLLHLRAAFKSGRWDEIIEGVLTGQFVIPTFDVGQGRSIDEVEQDSEYVETRAWRMVS